MTEDSKALADAGSFGAELHFTASHLHKKEFVDMLKGFLTSVANDIESVKGGLIGHVKLFARVDDGFIRMNIIDSRLGIDVGDEIKSYHITSGTIKVMAAVVGVNDERVREIIESRIDDLSKVLKLEVVEHEERDHDHCEDE